MARRISSPGKPGARKGRGRPRMAALGAAVALGALAVAGPALGAPGDLDPTFGTEGRVLTDFGGHDQATALAREADGRIVAVGATDAEGTFEFAVARYRKDGSLDRSFGGDGKVATDFGESGVAFAVAVQKDGRIVVAGEAKVNGRTSFALVRYRRDGSLDPSFGEGGKLITDFGDESAAFAVALQKDGKIVAAGHIGNVGRFEVALTRYRPNGALDPTFGAGGKVIHDFGTGLETFFALAIQNDGKIVAAGDVGDEVPQIQLDFLVARFRPDGSLDSAFGNGGGVVTDLGGADEAEAVLLRKDGRIVAVGPSFGGSAGGVALASYHPDGSLDPTFNGGGKVVTDLVGSARSFAAALQKDGRIVVAGTRIPRGDGDFAVARFRADGSLDPSFDGDGATTTDFGGDDLADAVLIQPDGKIVASGFSNGPGGRDFALARYLAR